MWGVGCGVWGMGMEGWGVGVGVGGGVGCGGGVWGAGAGYPPPKTHECAGLGVLGTLVGRGATQSCKLQLYSAEHRGPGGPPPPIHTHWALCVCDCADKSGCACAFVPMCVYVCVCVGGGGGEVRGARPTDGGRAVRALRRSVQVANPPLLSTCAPIPPASRPKTTQSCACIDLRQAPPSSVPPQRHHPL